MEPKIELSALTFSALKMQIELIQNNAEVTLQACRSLLDILARVEKSSGVIFETKDNYSRKK